MSEAKRVNAMERHLAARGIEMKARLTLILELYVKVEAQLPS